jgi:hypothetical protein
MSHNYRDGGKGDKPRPIPDKEQFAKNFEAIFGKKKKAIVEEVDTGVYVITITDNKESD